MNGLLYHREKHAEKYARRRSGVASPAAQYVQQHPRAIVAGGALLCLAWMLMSSGSPSMPSGGLLPDGFLTDDRVWEVCSAGDVPEAERGNVVTLRMAGCRVGDHGLELLSQFRRMETLDLGKAGLTQFPHALATLQHPTLAVVLMQGNAFKTLPDMSAMGTSVRFLGLRGCGVEGAVDAAVFPPSVVSLVLTDNRITALRNVAAALPHLRKLMLAHNALEGLPRLPPSLELIRLSNNPELPSDALTFATLPNLAWVAASGTGLAAPMQQMAAVIPAVPRTAVAVDTATRLGGNAGGDVYKGVYDGVPVAVKYYKSAGSDGTAADEVSMLQRVKAAGTLSAVAVLAPSTGTEPHAAQPGVVFPFLEGSRKLGGMPTFASVARDTAPAHDTSEALVRAALVTTARALRDLHAAGFAHGDFYAHNILWQPAAAGRPVVYLSDFGAAWAVPPPLRGAMAAAEVRAFGALVDDLALWCTSCDDAFRGGLARLHARCTAPLTQRATLDEVVGLVEAAA